MPSDRARSAATREEAAEQRAVGLGQVERRRDVRGAGSAGCGSAPAARCPGSRCTLVVLVDPGRRDLAGDDPAEQAVGHRRLHRSPELGFVLIRKPISPDQPGHQVRDVALALGAAPARSRSSARGRDPDEPAQVRALDEERDARGWRRRSRGRPAATAAGAASSRATTTSPRPVSASPSADDHRPVRLRPQQRADHAAVRVDRRASRAQRERQQDRRQEQADRERDVGREQDREAAVRASGRL